MQSLYTTKTSGSGGTGSWTAFAPVALTVVSAAFLAAGDVVTVSVIHTASGVAVPASLVQLFTTVR